MEINAAQRGKNRERERRQPQERTERRSRQKKEKADRGKEQTGNRQEIRERQKVGGKRERQTDRRNGEKQKEREKTAKKERINPHRGRKEKEKPNINTSTHTPIRLFIPPLLCFLHLFHPLSLNCRLSNASTPETAVTPTPCGNYRKERKAGGERGKEREKGRKNVDFSTG